MQRKRKTKPSSKQLEKISKRSQEEKLAYEMFAQELKEDRPPGEFPTRKMWDVRDDYQPEEEERELSQEQRDKKYAWCIGYGKGIIDARSALMGLLQQRLLRVNLTEMGRLFKKMAETKPEDLRLPDEWFVKMLRGWGGTAEEIRQKNAEHRRKHGRELLEKLPGREKRKFRSEAEKDDLRRLRTLLDRHGPGNWATVDELAGEMGNTPKAVMKMLQSLKSARKIRLYRVVSFKNKEVIMFD